MMNRDQLEFEISQYLDGTLGEAGQTALETRLAADADARALLAEYREIDAALKTRIPRPPALDWDTFATRISTAVAAQPEPAQSYKIGWFRAAAGLAVAASVLLAIGVGIRTLGPTQEPMSIIDITPAPPMRSQAPREITVVDRRMALNPSGQRLVVDVGPSKALQEQPALARYHDDVISRPSHVIIARSGHVAEDGSVLP